MDPPELQPGCYSELSPRQQPSGYNGPSRWQESLPGVFLHWTEQASCWKKFYCHPVALSEGGDEVLQLRRHKNKCNFKSYCDNTTIHSWLENISSYRKALTKVQVLVDIIRNRIWSWGPHLRQAVSDVTMELAPLKQRLCNPQYTKQE